MKKAHLFEEIQYNDPQCGKNRMRNEFYQKRKMTIVQVQPNARISLFLACMLVRSMTRNLRLIGFETTEMFRHVFFAVDKGLAFRHDASVFYSWTRNAFRFVSNTGTKRGLGDSRESLVALRKLVLCFLAGPAKENFGRSRQQAADGAGCWKLAESFLVRKPRVRTAVKELKATGSAPPYWTSTMHTLRTVPHCKYSFFHKRFEWFADIASRNDQTVDVTYGTSCRRTLLGQVS